MSDDWFDGYAAGDFLPEVPDLRAQIDAVGEMAVYAQGYVDGVGLAAAKLRDERWNGWAEGFADACRATDTTPGPHAPRNAVRPRPLYGVRNRARRARFSSGQSPSPGDGFGTRVPSSSPESASPGDALGGAR